MGNLQVRFLEGWAPAMAPGYSTMWLWDDSTCPVARYRALTYVGELVAALKHLNLLPGSLQVFQLQVA